MTKTTLRIHRVFRIIALITRDPNIWSRHSLAKRFSISERMIQKDLTIIRHDIGLDLIHDHGTYHFGKNPFDI